ncbi:hypothetical protein C7475_103563 [Chitinophaga sp. S165]|nr:hypothetical protein C7475_103563 [Chitinophaga sp. S165]
MLYISVIVYCSSVVVVYVPFGKAVNLIGVALPASDLSSANPKDHYITNIGKMEYVHPKNGRTYSIFSTVLRRWKR